MDILQKRIGLEDLENLSELFGRKIFPGYVEMSRSYEEDEIENDILKVNEQSFRRRLGHAPIWDFIIVSKCWYWLYKKD